MFQLSDHCFDVFFFYYVHIPSSKIIKKDNDTETMSHASKILLTIILNRMKKKIEAELPDEQAGFRAGRSIVDNYALCSANH